MISRRHFIERLAATGAAAALTSNAAPAAAEAPAAIAPARQGAPNILIFMPDQQAGSTVLPGSQVIKPHLDRFVSESLAFTHAHCPAPHCCPSRTSFLSGWYPSEHGVFNNVETDTAIHFNPAPGTPFWGKWLAAAGYNTGYSGKLHVGRDIVPADCGFTDFGNLKKGHHDNSETGHADMMAKYANSETDVAKRKPGEILRPDWNPNQLYKTLPNEGPTGYDNQPDTKVVRTGIAGMERFAKDGKPWCVMISTGGGAHDPYDVPKKFVDLYNLAKIELPPSFHDTMDDKPRIYQRQRYEYWSQLSDEETRDSIRHYYAKCSFQDALFGEILDALEKTGQAENTIVLYTSDHGDYHAAHGLWMKGVPAFREAYNIPSVVRWPAVIHQAGKQLTPFVDQVDWSATFLEAAGVTAPTKLSGQSLMPFFRGETPASWRTATFSQMNGVELYYTQRITMTHDWKYVYNGFDYDELYDLKNDPHEMHNLAFPDLSAKRKAVLESKGLQPGQLPWPALDPKLEAVRKDLLARMWTFAAAHNDIIFNPYGTVALAPYGPGLGTPPKS